MNIELRGVQFVNKGAELMLRTIMDTMKSKNPNSKFVMELFGESTIELYKSNGIYTKLNILRGGIDTGDLGKYLPALVRKKYHLISENEIEVIFDSSGFAYGDFWGVKKAQVRMSNQIQKWKKQGKKVVLLPQAFGPFKDEELRKSMANILKHADLIFARDNYSLEYLVEIAPEYSSKVFLSPDFTNLTKGILPENFNYIDHQVAIIPNLKMLESKMFKDPYEYYKILKDFVDKIIHLGLKPYFLLHEVGKDKIVSSAVNNLLKSPIPIIEESDPIKIKGIINTSKAVIGSRFHGLVSALSQGVPVLCLGWSHKYEALLEDYDFSEGMIPLNGIDEKFIDEKLDTVLNPQKRPELLSKLKESSEKQKRLSEQMWEKVFDVISV
uniref:polysaccharide pyruvyl transferase family protein n=1 Tax=Algoriphagus sp. TaxID=1872435 RepID=UPI0040482945